MTIKRHTDATRGRIGKSIADSAWRRQAGDKSAELQSPSPFDEDFATPRPHPREPRLWEEQS